MTNGRYTAIAVSALIAINGFVGTMVVNNSIELARRSSIIERMIEDLRTVNDRLERLINDKNLSR